MTDELRLTDFARHVTSIILLSRLSYRFVSPILIKPRGASCGGVPSEPIVFFFCLTLTEHTEQSPQPGLNSNEVVV